MKRFLLLLLLLFLTGCKSTVSNQRLQAVSDQRTQIVLDQEGEQIRVYSEEARMDVRYSYVYKVGYDIDQFDKIVITITDYYILVEPYTAGIASHICYSNNCNFIITWLTR